MGTAWAIVTGLGAVVFWDIARRWVAAWQLKRVDMTRIESLESDMRNRDRFQSAARERVEEEVRRVDREQRTAAEKTDDALKLHQKAIVEGFKSAKLDLDEWMRQQQPKRGA